MTRAAEIWLDVKERESLSPSTMRDYRGYVGRTIKQGRLSNLSISEANDVSQIEAWLTEVADERGETAAKQARNVLSGILALAERRDAIASSIVPRVRTPGAKPGTTGDRKCKDPDYDCGKRHLGTARAFTEAEMVRVQSIADAARSNVGDLTAFLFGTGVRISEALHHTAWADVDLGTHTVRVRGTKTAQADRVLRIGTDLTERLHNRAKTFGRVGLVFGITYFDSKVGLPRDRNNVSRVLRRVFERADRQHKR